MTLHAQAIGLAVVSRGEANALAQLRSPTGTALLTAAMFISN
jgi:hypothetical protein